jgi:TolB-like protein/Tfp pilus assembly protein PilF/predicted Ser/Thr protein kinase
VTITVGSKLGPYEILAQIGAGGMGEVWKARDTRLDRIVAVKRLKGQHSARFEQEARAIAALNHPNICTLHDVGPDYLVMEYIEGKPLAGKLLEDEAVRLAVQIASALEEAHGCGILHRDLKPANILVTAKGAAKLLDFGLAKLAADGNATQTMGIAGTPLYMSPEQAEGKALDARSDVFSFGSVLYEALTGRRPFDSLAAVLRDEPTPLQSPAGDIVKRCLAKKAGDRFQSMAEVRVALEQMRAKPVEQQPSIAVLPFANMNADREQEYFSDGLAEEILNGLAQVKGLKVIARTSSFAFRGKEQDITKIAETLRVGTILEGSVRRAGSRLRVTCQLIDAADGSHLWSQRYDREMADVFAIQDEISAAIVDALKVKLAPAKRVAVHAPNLDAYHAYLKGRHHASLVAPNEVERARSYFERAIALDASYAEPWAGLAGCYMALAMERPDAQPRELMQQAREAAQRAVELDPSKPDGHLWLARVAATLDYDWTEAMRRYRLAVACGGIASHEQATCVLFLLLPLQLLDEALAVCDATIAADPLAAMPRLARAVVFRAQGFLDESSAELRRLLELHSGFYVGLIHLGYVLILQKRLEEAVAILERARQLAPWHMGGAALLAVALQRTGQPERAEELIAGFAGNPNFASIFYASAGDYERAAAEFSKLIEMRHPVVVLSVELAREFRDSSWGQHLLRKMNLASEHSAHFRAESKTP